MDLWLWMIPRLHQRVVPPTSINMSLENGEWMTALM